MKLARLYAYVEYMRGTQVKKQRILYLLKWKEVHCDGTVKLGE
jgi:hypothetical protein